MTLALRFARLPPPGSAAVFYEAYGCSGLLRPRQRHQISVQCCSKLRLYTASSQTKKKNWPAADVPSTTTKTETANVPLPPAPPSTSGELPVPPISTPPSSSAAKPTQPTVAAASTDAASSANRTPPANTAATTAAAAKPKLSREVVRQNVQGYVFTRYFDYVKNYDKVLEKNFPSAVKVYRVFFDGVKEFYADMRRYLKISRIANDSPNGLKALNRKELELYMQMPRDMVKVAPALIFSSLPFVGYAIFPLVFMYPRTYLTTHFWSLQQRVEFQQLKLQERLSCNRPVFRCLQAKLKSTRKNACHAELSQILGLIGSGFHPSVDALLEIKDVFAEPPYSLLALSGKHIKLLTQMHGVPGGWFKRHRLTEHAYIVHHMDLAIRREGGVHNMSADAIRNSCHIRGLNPSNLASEEMIEWLRAWIRISTSIQEQHISLFLHLPLLLAYNHPNNWQLVYGSSGKQQEPPSSSSSSPLKE